MFVFLSQPIHKIEMLGNGANGQSQAQCLVFCPNLKNKAIGNGMKQVIVGSKYFDTIPVYLVLALLMLSEMRDIVFYICSNWTKVALFCNYITHTSWQQSPMVQRCIGCVLKYCSSKMMNNSGYKMSQGSILVFGRRCFFPWRSYQRKIKVPSVVKATVFEAFKGQMFVQDEGLKVSSDLTSPCNFSFQLYYLYIYRLYTVHASDQILSALCRKFAHPHFQFQASSVTPTQSWHMILKVQPTSYLCGTSPHPYLR